MTDPFARRQDESAQQWVVRLHLDPWFEEASSSELADFTGLRIEHVEAALRRWASSSRIRRMHQHATQVADVIGWQGTPDALVHLALERFAQRFDERQRERLRELAGSGTATDEEIRRFLIENRKVSGVSA